VSAETRQPHRPADCALAATDLQLQVVPRQAHGLLFFQAGITPAGRVPGVPVSGAKAGAGLS